MPRGRQMMAKIKKKMLIFCGPSICSKEKKQLKSRFGHIEWMPPIKRGDVELALSQNVKEILIIDGYFENENPIWQRELFKALQEGVTIFGSTSMGALRAAELSEYGMIGIGEIYRMYLTGEIDGDDEVALCHSDEQINGEYIETTIPLINLRYALKNLRDKKTIISLEKVIQKLKLLSFENRSVTIVRNLMNGCGVDNEGTDYVIDSINKTGKYNLKRLDAKNAIIQVMSKKSNGMINLRGKFRDRDENLMMTTDGIRYRKLKEEGKEIQLGTLIDSNAEGLKKLYEQVAEALHTRFYVGLWCENNDSFPDPGYYFEIRGKKQDLDTFQAQRGGFTKREREIALNKKILTHWVKSKNFKKRRLLKPNDNYNNIDYIFSEISKNYLGKTTEKSLMELKFYPPSKFGFNYDERLELLSYWDIEKFSLVMN